MKSSHKRLMQSIGACANASCICSKSMLASYINLPLLNDSLNGWWSWIYVTISHSRGKISAFFFFFKTVSFFSSAWPWTPYIAQAGLELELVLLPQPLECWDDRRAPPSPACLFFSFTVSHPHHAVVIHLLDLLPAGFQAADKGVRPRAVPFCLVPCLETCSC